MMPCGAFLGFSHVVVILFGLIKRPVCDYALFFGGFLKLQGTLIAFQNMTLQFDIVIS